MLRRLLILMPGLVAAATGVLQVGCGDDADETSRSDRPDDIEPEVDAGLLVMDASAVDAFQPNLGSPGLGFPANAEAGFAGDASGPAARSDCYDATPRLDCSSPECSVIPVCCVGTATQGCCVSESVVPMVTFASGSCTSLDCAAGARPFGEPGPTFTDGLVAGGGASSDGGLVWEPAIDLRNRSITLSATFRPPASCDDGCFETIGLALLREPPAPTGAVLAEPVVALRYSGATRSIFVEARGDVLRDFEGEPVAAEWSLEVTPAGEVIVRRGAEVLFADAGRVRPEWLHPAVIGRTRNPSASGNESAALTSLRVGAATCDIPSGWAAGAPVEFTAAPTGRLRSPSLSLGDPSLLVVQVDGSLRFYRRSVSGRYDPLSVEIPASPVVRHARFTHGGLVALGDDGAVLRGTLEGLDGSPRLRWEEAPLVPPCESCARSDPSAALSVDGSQVVLVLEGGVPALYANGVREPGYSSLIAEVMAPDPAAGEDRLESLHLRRGLGAWRVDATYRRGTRSSVRHFVSEEMILWRGLGRVFGPSGQGFDALEVRDFAEALGEDGSVVRAVYIGHDGVSDRVGTTTRPAL